MAAQENTIPQKELSGRLQKLMFLRVLLVSLFLGASIFIEVKHTKTYFGDIQTSHYLLIATIYFLTFVYVILLKRLKNLAGFAYVQLLVDTFLVTVIIYTTGGIESIFSFLYILTIINGSIILYRKGGMIIASSSSILYGLLLDLHYYNIVHPLGSLLNYGTEYRSIYLFYLIVVNMTAFYAVALLSGYASEQARRSRVELKAKQKDIINLEALNERIIDNITSGLITLDSQNKVILFNPAAENIFNISSDHAIGRYVVEILPPLRPFFDSAATGGGPYIQHVPGLIDLPYQRPDGKKLFLRFSISTLQLPEADQKGRILVFQDLTQMKKIEEEMRKVEHLALAGELAAGVAHEIRNPLASISGSIQMLREGLKMDEVNSRLMEIILREISRLNHLVNDFLLFTRPKKPELKEFDLIQLIYDSLELFRNSDRWNQNVQLHVELDGPIPLKSDPEQLKQVLWNLFLNATEAMPNGGQLHVSAGKEDGSEDESIRMCVRDTGLGFSPNVLSHLFTPFFTTKDGGSGLGLAIVKRIVEELKGTVNGKNHPDGGAEITIRLRGGTEG